MKKMLSLLVITSLTFVTFAQSGKVKSCCSMASKSSQFATLTARADFKDAHLSPEPFNYVSENGETLTYNTPDGKTAKVFAIKSATKTNKVLIVVHEWWGLNDYIKREAETLQKELGNVDVYAIDLYDGQVATDPETAGKLMGSLNGERAASIVKGLITMVGTDKQIGTIGWCMGGSWSFQSALLAGSQTKACVMYYGFPEKDASKMKNLNTDVLYIHAAQDSFIPKEAIDQFAKDLKSVGKTIEVKPYPADHAFANPSNPKYSKTLADDAHKVVLAYLKKGLGL
ncbi:MAG: dienelactone hydrolase family protein [Cytophagales bacterium]